ncbi:hypothetical protein [Sessilibacter corallicola]|uniref:hypothetical protein n=1 Tax=Sessilibacter corallicola TaxID=2904075 RepID=UPI00333F4187
MDFNRALNRKKLKFKKQKTIFLQKNEKKYSHFQKIGLFSSKELEIFFQMLILCRILISNTFSRAQILLKESKYGCTQS